MTTPDMNRAASPERFTFGIPLIARAAARDWARVCALLCLTLTSVLAQSDPDFQVLLAGHDCPECWTRRVGGDPRFRFLPADWPIEAPTVRNDDGGRKKALIRQHVDAAGGGLLMFLDADDLVDTGLVRSARAWITPDRTGALIDQGVAIDFARMRAVQFPCPGAFDGGFHQLCGSSTVARLDPASPDPLRRDPFPRLGSHHEWEQRAREQGASLVRLPVWGAYLVNTGQNHSEREGPFAAWRRQFSRTVARDGRPLTGPLTRRFGLLPEDFAQAAAVPPGRLGTNRPIR